MFLFSVLKLLSWMLIIYRQRGFPGSGGIKPLLNLIKLDTLDSSLGQTLASIGGHFFSKHVMLKQFYTTAEPISG